MKWLAHPLIVVGITLVAGLIYLSLQRGGAAAQQSALRVQQERERVAEMESTNNQLLQQLEQANTPLAKEKMIRNQLLMQKEGEYVVQLVMDPRATPAPAEPKPQQTPLDAWKKLILGQR